MTQSRSKNKVQAPKIPTGDIDADFKAVIRHAKGVLTRFGKLAPTLFLLDSASSGLGVISGTDLPEDPDVKRTIFQNIGADMANERPGIDCFMFISEAWASKRDTIEGLRPLYDPDHIEILMVAAKRTNGDERHCLFPFTKDKDGKIRFVKDKDLIKLNNSGWLKYGDIKDGEHTQNILLTTLWKSFLFNRVVKQ